MKSYDNSVARPSGFDGYVCDPSVKTRLLEHIKAAHKRGCMPPHLLLSGGPGTGKTTLAGIIARTLNVPMIKFVGAELTRADQLRELFKLPEYGGVLFCDECLPAGSLVVWKDGGVSGIEEILGGELHGGGVIKNTLTRMADTLLRITTSHGEITTTPTHPHMGYFPKYEGKLDGEGKVAETRAADLKVGDYLLSVATVPHTVKNSWTPEQLAFVAMVIADGCITTGKYKGSSYVGTSIQLSWGKPAQFRRAKTIVENAVNTFGIKPTSYSCVQNRDYVIRIYGVDFVKLICDTFSIPATGKKYTATIGDEIFYAPLASVKSFVDTVLAFEGWKAEGHGKYMQMSSPTFIRRFQVLLKKFGIASGVYRFKPGKRKATAFRLNISDKRSNQTPVMFRGIPMLPARITKVEVVRGPVKVYDFTTSTGYFVADGFFTHNCHSVSKEVAELLYPVMEDGILPAKGNARLQLQLSPLMVIGATTEPGSLAQPLLDRFTVKMRIPEYTPEQMVEIVRGMAKGMAGATFGDYALQRIAQRSRGTPRVAGGLLTQVVASAIANGVSHVTEEFVSNVSQTMGIDANGMDRTDAAVLKALATSASGMGLETLAMIVQEDPAWVARSCEPFLIRQGYMLRTKSGRVLTEAGKAVASRM